MNNYTALICDQYAKGKSMATSARGVLAGLGISETGALTAADQKKLKDVAQEALDQAGSFAKNQSVKKQLDKEIREAASKRALTRMLMDYPQLFRQLTVTDVAYIKSLSYTELAGVNGSGGTLAMYANPQAQDPGILMQSFDNYYQMAAMDLKEESGASEDYDRNQECAMTLATVATAKVGDEAERMGTLYGPARQANFNAIRGLSTAVRNIAPDASSQQRKLRK